ncbi:AraC-type DNA-binding protein [Chitinophaga costaii]|uniref:AraC-type DNA-binding protein n=1 Tax=Chitinophaga costaii TaxID=1335309 RepID=A0A1C3YS89_9BACT|nr:AraC family transcriptional regulator [Chitinophaga costaii]PUZ30082.1 AraC family transcriptional regulator [Chitinophaga costaii]SCB72933.1 AraC-type DNA-binding protein [Chitinophaga costaii]
MKVLPFTISHSFQQSVIVKKEHQPFFYTHLHRHDEIQLTWIQEGEGTLVVGNTMEPFTADDIFFLGANIPHVLRHDPSYYVPESTKKIRATTIFFNPKGKLAAVLELPEMEPVKVLLQKFKEGFKVPIVCQRTLAKHITQVINSQNFERLFTFFGLMFYLASLKNLHPFSTHSAEMLTVREAEGVKIGKIYNYILQHFATDIKLDDITGIAHMTPQAFCRYFKKHTGHTFISFLHEVRIHEACKRLTGGSYESIGSIAYTCGFNNITHFNRIFKKLKGCNPKEYADTFSKNIA